MEIYEIMWTDKKPNIFPAYGFIIEDRFVRVFQGGVFLNRTSIHMVAKSFGFHNYLAFFKKFNKTQIIKQ